MIYQATYTHDCRNLVCLKSLLSKAPSTLAGILSASCCWNSAAYPAACALCTHAIALHLPVLISLTPWMLLWGTYC